MSRRSVTTIIASVKLRVPPGSSAAEVIEYITRGLREWKTSEIYKAENLSAASMPINSLDLDSMIVKLEKKETVYL